MKLHFGIGLMAALAVSMCARADEPAVSPAVIQIDAIIDFCSKIDPANRGAYERLQRQALATQSDRDGRGDHDRKKDLAQFRRAVDSFGEELDKLPRPWAIQTCKAGVGK